MLDFENTSSRGSVQCESFVEGFGQPAIGSEGDYHSKQTGASFRSAAGKDRTSPPEPAELQRWRAVPAWSGNGIQAQVAQARVVKICKQSSRHLV